TKMAAKPERVFGFLRELAAKVKPVAERELSELREFARAHLAIDELQPWDVAYTSEKLRQHRYALSDEELRPYFPLEAACSGLFHVAERAFGVHLRERRDVDVWHPDVRYYELVDEGGAAFAGIYFDLYARAAKRGGAWVEGCQARRRHERGVQRPVA